MKSNEKTTFNEIFVRSLTFRKTGHFKNVKDDKSLSLKLFITSALVIFMFNVPAFAGTFKKHSILWSLLVAFVSFVFNSTLVLVLAGIAFFFLQRGESRNQIEFVVVYNVVAVSLVQSMLVFSCIRLLLAVVDIFDPRIFTWLMFFPERFVAWIWCAWIAVVVVNSLMIYVNLASLRRA